MTTTADRIASQLDARNREKQADIEAKYRRLIDKMARNEAIDEEAAAITIETLGRTSAQVRSDVDRQLARIRQSERAATLATALEEFLRSRESCEAYLAESERVIESRKQGDKIAISTRDNAQAAYLRVTSQISELATDDDQQVRARAAAIESAADSIVRRRIAAKQQLEVAETALATAKGQGLKKAELSEQADAVDVARSALATVDSELAAWSAQWNAVLEERLTLPPAKPQPPAPLHHQFGPGFPVR